MILLDGKAVAQELRDGIAVEVRGLQQKPGLAVVVIGDDPASHTYVASKERLAKEMGFHSVVIRKSSISQEELLAMIDALNADEAIDGILVQHPLPDPLNEEEILARILPDKDVDGFLPVNVGRLVLGQKGFISCTPKGILRLLDHYDFDYRGKHAVVIGRSAIVGKPMAALLLNRDMTVTVVHSKTKELKALVSQADLVVAAVGRPHFVTADMIKKGAWVIDVGINRVDGVLVGDVDFTEVSKVAAALTPVPGGVGPMTIAMLLENTLEAHAWHRKS